MLTEATALAVAEYFDRIGPSHDVIEMLVVRAGLRQLDPGSRTDNGEPLGKKKRLRIVLIAAFDRQPREGDELLRSLLHALRSHGSFTIGSQDDPGPHKRAALAEALASEGYRLESDGQVLPISLDTLQGVELTDALEAYVRRALRGAGDDPLLVGTAKDLVEAIARHVTLEATGAYPIHANFEATVWQSFDRLDMATPSSAMIEALDKDPARALEQAAMLLSIAENRLRNSAGTGHGRPQKVALSSDLARFATQASGLVGRLLLDRLARRKRQAA